MRHQYCVMAFIALTAGLAGRQVDGQSAHKQDVSATKGCTDIDFWEGEWAVHRLDGAKIATVSIKLSNGHCLATEYWHYSKLRGGGHSVGIMAYSNQRHNWEYLGGYDVGDRWRFSDGHLIGNELRFDADDMPEGATQTFSFFNLPDGRIRELELESSDGGKTWKTNVEIYWSKK
jgi:hypothetical protein